MSVVAVSLQGNHHHSGGHTVWTEPTRDTAAAAAPSALRVYRYAMDPTPAQVENLQRHAGAARWAFNHAIAAKVAAHRQWRARVKELIDAGVDEPLARRQAKVPLPSKPAIQRDWNRLKGDTRTMTPGYAPWWHEVSTYAFQSAFADADRAWSNWLDSLAGRRAGRRVGYPRFKKKGRARDSFRLHHDVKHPAIRLEGYRRLRMPRLGSIRLHGSSKQLARRIARGKARIQSVTASRSGDRWYVSVLCQSDPVVRAAPSRRQAAAGLVGVDVGVKVLAALSTGELVDAPRHLQAAEKRLVAAQRALSRTQKTSRRRAKARARLARRHHEVALRRASALHQLTKRLATGWAVVGVEDLNVAGISASARGTLAAPGRNVAAKAGLNRAILDRSFGELRRQLAYKTSWYGSELRVVDRWAPTSQACSTCGRRDPSLTLSQRTYRCPACGLVMDRDVNAARNIAQLVVDPVAWHAAVASGTGETRNARGGRVSPSPTASTVAGGQWPLRREDPPPPGGRSPRRSNSLAFPHTA